jgi:hypothetical protein
MLGSEIRADSSPNRLTEYETVVMRRGHVNETDTSVDLRLRG